MTYPWFCRFFIAVQMMRRRRVFETLDNLRLGLKTLKRRGTCKLCRRCRILWYLASAIDMKDPYNILESYEMLRDQFHDDKISNAEMDCVREAMEWVGKHKKVKLKDECVPDKAINVIRLWHAQSLDFSHYERIKNMPSELIWPLEIIKGSICESAGNLDASLRSYRNALAIMPNWIPEAKTTFEKISELRMR